MKKIALAAVIAALAITVVPTIGKTDDYATDIHDKLKSKGLQGIEQVQVADDSITQTDYNGKNVKRDKKKAVVIDLNFESSSEINDKYGDVIKEIYQNKAVYKAETRAEYIKVNIKRNGELVAELDINERNERTMHIYDDKNISSIGMGMSLPKVEWERQQALISSVKAAGK